MIAFLFVAALQQVPPQAADADTHAWWATTSLLSSDAMEGRDTGSPGYDRAARLVADRLAAAGLKPLGENGTWFQRIMFDQVAVESAEITVGERPLRFLYEITVGAANAPAMLEAPLVYRGYCGPNVLGDVRGKAVICHNTRRIGLPTAADRTAALTSAGAAAIISIADPGFTVEPPRWPSAYSRSITIANGSGGTGGIPALSLNADALDNMILGVSHDAKALINAGSAGRPLPSFDIPALFRASFTIKRKSLESANIVGILPGTDPGLADQAIVLTAHLDGFGYGATEGGDSLYNGTLDDAAYVALLVQLAERRAGRGFRRPIILAILTGEEKGLLGSRWFINNLPVPKAHIVANINLDQLRPLFPLDLLTVHALDDSTLGDDARVVASSLGIAVQNDPEPERGLLRRSDHWNFIQAGIPAINFVFGYRPGTESERIYRQWYRDGYHTPKDDLNQQIDWRAAADFNRFFYTLVDRVADQDGVPVWKSGSSLRPN
jgi:hypothetical protein